MIVDTPDRRRLIISGVIDGGCVVRDGSFAFKPNRADKPPEAARYALLDDQAVRIVSMVRSDDSGVAVYTARYEVQL